MTCAALIEPDGVSHDSRAEARGWLPGRAVRSRSGAGFRRFPLASAREGGAGEMGDQFASQIAPLRTMAKPTHAA